MEQRNSANKIESSVDRPASKIFDDSPLMHCVEEEEIDETQKSIPQLTRTASTPYASRETTPTSSTKTFHNNPFRIKQFTPPLNRSFSITSYPSPPKQLGCGLSPLSFNYLMQAAGNKSKNSSCSKTDSSSLCNPSTSPSQSHNTLTESLEGEDGQSPDRKRLKDHLNSENQQQLNHQKTQMTHTLPKPLPKPKLYTLSATTAAATPSIHSMRRERYFSRRTISDQGPSHQTHLWGNSSPGMWGRRKDPKRTSAPSMNHAVSHSSTVNGSSTGTGVSSPSSSGSNNSGAKYSLFVKNRNYWSATPIYKRR